jgi:hypothetical protein
MERVHPPYGRDGVLTQQGSRRFIALWHKPRGGAAGFFSGFDQHHDGGLNPWHSV